MTSRLPFGLAAATIASFALTACVGDSPGVVPPEDGGAGIDVALDAASGIEADVDAPSLTAVKGTVVDDMGVPIKDATVRIGATDAKTDATGAFTTMALTQYDAIVVSSTLGTTTPTDSDKRVTIFLGLSSRTPRLAVAGANAHATTFTFQSTGVAFPLTSGDAPFVAIAPSNASTRTSVMLDASSSPTIRNLTWSGEAPAQGMLHGFIVTRNANFPSAWKAAAPPVAYTMNGPTANATLAFGPAPSVGDVVVTIAPSNQTIAGLLVAYEPVPGARIVLGQLLGFAQTSKVSVMPTAGMVFATALGGTPSGAAAEVWRAKLKSPVATTLTLPPGDLVLGKPFSAATGVAVGDEFTWTAPNGYMHHTRVTCGSAPVTYLADIVGATTSMTLPNVSNLGVTLPPSTTCKWTVTAFGPVVGVDNLVGPTSWLDRESFVDADSDGTSFVTGSRSFTTK